MINTFLLFLNFALFCYYFYLIRDKIENDMIKICTFYDI